MPHTRPIHAWGTDESQLLHLYRRIVYCRALAELIERYRSFDATNSGEQKVRARALLVVDDVIREPVF